jgi:hypothetical protein
VYLHVSIEKAGCQEKNSTDKNIFSGHRAKTSVIYSQRLGKLLLKVFRRNQPEEFHFAVGTEIEGFLWE